VQRIAVSPEVQRIIASEDRLAEAAAEVFALPTGRVIRQPAFPHVFDANVVRHPRLDPGDLDPALAQLAAPLRAVGARHLQITCDATPLSDRLRSGLRSRGFLCDRLLVMTLPGTLARRASRDVTIGSVPDEVPFDWYAETMDRMSREEPWYSPPVSREIIGSLAAKAAAGALKLHVAQLGGQAVGAAGLGLGDGATAGVGTIVTVGTVPEARQRRVAQSMVVTLAQRARAAGCDLVYLVARADDTPKDMYRKIGFEPAFTFEVWLRPPL
jgi:ribosomal protein S18 acetylase RimI-like enzyme